MKSTKEISLRKRRNIRIDEKRLGKYVREVRSNGIGGLKILKT